MRPFLLYFVPLNQTIIFSSNTPLLTYTSPLVTWYDTYGTGSNGTAAIPVLNHYSMEITLENFFGFMIMT